MMRYSMHIVDFHGDATDPTKDVITRYRQLSAPYGEKAYWFLITDAFYEVIATCMIGDDDENNSSKHHYKISEKWENLGFDKKLDEMIQTYEHHMSKTIN
jgi:hypothetical protein